MTISGVALSTTSLIWRMLEKGSTKNMARPRTGSLPSARNSSAAMIAVNASASSGDSSDISFDGCGRASSLSMARSLAVGAALPGAGAGGLPADGHSPDIHSPMRSMVASAVGIDGDMRPWAMTIRRSAISNSSSSSSLTMSSAQPASRSFSSSPRISAAAPTSTPQVGWRDDQQLRVRVDLAADDELLQVAARQALRRRAGAAGLDVEALDQLGGEQIAPPLVLIQPEALTASVRVSKRVLRQRHHRHRAAAQALLRHEVQALLAAPSRRMARRCPCRTA